MCLMLCFGVVCFLSVCSVFKVIEVNLILAENLGVQYSSGGGCIVLGRREGVCC